MIWSTIYTLDGELSRAPLVKFYLEKIIEARRELVYSIFSDYENYEKILPSYFPSIRIRSIRGNVAVVEEHMNLGNHELIIMAKHVTESPVTHDVFVIGGGSTALTEACFIARFAKNVTMVHTSPQFRVNDPIKDRALADPKIKMIHNSYVKEIKGDGKR